MRSRLAGRGCSLLVWFAGSMYASWILHVLVDAERLVSFVSDDAFYHLHVGDKIAAGRGSTFDGLNETNGYHPLWMVAVAALRLLAAGADKLLSLRIVLLVQAALTIGTIALIWKTLRPTIAALPAASALVFFASRSPRPSPASRRPLRPLRSPRACGLSYGAVRRSRSVGHLLR